MESRRASVNKAGCRGLDGETWAEVAEMGAEEGDEMIDG